MSDNTASEFYALESTESRFEVVKASEVTMDDTLFGYTVTTIAVAEHNHVPALRFTLNDMDSGLEVARLVILKDAPVLVGTYDPTNALNEAAPRKAVPIMP